MSSFKSIENDKKKEDGQEGNTVFLILLKSWIMGNEYPQSMFEQKQENITILYGNFYFIAIKIALYCIGV